ncbi:MULTISPECIES: MurR/RpiR family transcriptional regulator [unclassified Sphingomonas]|uniref:MurR/RpiR family transcriptional regulator n=1 Tax=unclassified Sphingomonas TaxID=196159 RepID=UPI0006FB268C|nr:MULTISPECIES: MurR/RpiR family transcriptional regulator [unclassified Sphingomonas]KQM61406.1 iron dicitrate transport regulator FecR [Sphingomonas sp. Leaf16]KQN12501.1 iron dicitrate transport regulator FecR [Sphingomonas sp. Leaf29]KQN18981.1 iron dicitrate transport regulator FecR [Sphingomonas sp. Leaf32]
MTEADTPVPQTAAELRQTILDRHDGLSKRLQHVARYVLDHPDDMALQPLSVIAARSGTQPSTIVRFAKSLGFTGAGPMQRLLRDSLLAKNASLGYGERVHQFTAAVDQSVSEHGVGSLIDEFTEGDILALQNTRLTIGQDGLADAVALIRKAQIVHVVGMRRAFPVAAYLAYAVPQAGKPTVLIDGVGGLTFQQFRAMSPRDLLIAISYNSYAPETVSAVEAAAAAGTKILAISDSLASPIARHATQTLVVRESEVRGFRSLAASLCVAQALVVGLAYEKERGVRRTKAVPAVQDAS